MRTSDFQLDEADPSIMIKMRFGPPKSFERAVQKKLKDLRDLNRVTAAFEDPFALFVFFLVLRKHVTISGIKNWFHPDPENPGAEGEFKRPPVLHLFVDWDGAGYQVEVMLMLKNFLEVKKAQHLVYEILR